MKHHQDEQTYHSKILLFGEYSIIQNSMGLSIPYHSYKGKLAFAPTGDNSLKVRHSRAQLRAFLKYLKQLQKEDALQADIDTRQMEKDLKEGLYFDSDIPQGFGVGSSGALVAAIYSRYARNKYEREKITSADILKLKEALAQMESFFHGKSSGIDPLICYLDLPLLIQSKDNIGTVTLPATKEGKGAIFLIDTGRPGRTQPLVQWFLEKCKQQDFLTLFHEHYIPFNDQCIRDFLKGETKNLFVNLYHVSKFLFENLEPMIPKLFRKSWQKGLETGAYYLKLCGSGGGGFLLGFTQNIDVAREYLRDHQIKIIHTF
ncbi:MAG: mevalonate kinase [Chitinophagales bacterium]|nr:MAG: mevalonate kinase [Chitinophagales bacterium]